MKTNELFLLKKIRELARRADDKPARPVRLGIGDDAAVLEQPRRDRELLVTTDLLVEGSHFDRDRHPARALGHKLVARGLSDIAAMGGEPLYALLSLCLPPWSGPRWQRQFFAGMFGLARRHGIALIGGDLSAGERFVADIIVLGTARRGRTLERGKAKPGDIIYVSGRLGGSALGLGRLRSAKPRAGDAALQRHPYPKHRPALDRPAGPVGDAAVRRHLYPQPRLALGKYLSARLGVKAAMDLSDGLSIDLYRLAAESKVGAEIHATGIPIFPGATLDQALHGGEDYELLFTLDPRRKAPPAFEGLPLTPIGRITSGRRLLLVGPDGRKRPLPIKGFQHQL